MSTRTWNFLRKLKKDVIFALIFWIFLALFAPLVGLAAGEPPQPYAKKFLVSAYYSPLPNQTRYARGTYEGDLRLNGNGVAWADGTGVYVGMLAAPQNYNFGTKIKLPWLGIGTVHDRGGAIISHADYDRIDVWMGYGDEGLNRALNWGMRMVAGTIYPVGETQGLKDQLDYTWIPSLSDAQAVKTAAVKKIKPAQSSIFPHNLGGGEENSEEDVKLLQSKLKELGYLQGEPNGKYDAITITAVFAFQKEKKILTAQDEFGAGYFGSKTRAALNRILTQKTAEQPEQQIFNVAEETETTRLLISAGLGKNAEGSDVEQLQKYLQKLGYYQGEINGKYDADTIDAVFLFQKEHQVVQTEEEFGAGYFGAKTKQALEQAVAKEELKLDFGKNLAQLNLSAEKIKINPEDIPIVQFKPQVSAEITPMIVAP